MRNWFRVLLVAPFAALTCLITIPSASADDAVANVCAVPADVVIATLNTEFGGINITELSCGEGVGDVFWATVEDHPFFVKVHGSPSECFAAGTMYFPNNKGYEETTEITPTVRCPRVKVPVFSTS